MKKFKLSQLLDTFIIFILIFAISFIWLRYLISEFFLSLIASLFVTIFLILLRTYISNKKQAKLKIKKDRETHINDCSNAMLFNTFEENCEFFINMLKHKYDIEIRNNYLFLKNQQDEIALFPMYDNKKISQDNLLACLKSVKNINLTKIIIVCCEYENNVCTIASNYKTKTHILNKIQTYNEILCVYKVFPEINNQNKVDEKITFSFLLRNAINKKKAKTYFWGGAFLLLASFVIRYNVYYIIFSTVMFCLCLFSVLSDKIYKTTKTEIL